MFVVFLRLLHSQLCYSIDLKIYCLLSAVQAMKKCAADSDTQIMQKISISVSLSYLRYPSNVQFYIFSLFASENSEIFHGEARLQLTPADQVLFQRTRLRHRLRQD